jgi:uncharacterized membrane protein YhaH (DUF805 family)
MTAKTAWWLPVFYLLPSALTQLTKLGWPAGTTITVLQSVLVLAAFALTTWGFVEIGCLRGTAGENTYGPNPLLHPNGDVEELQKRKKPGGQNGHRACI